RHATIEISEPRRGAMAMLQMRRRAGASKSPGAARRQSGRAVPPRAASHPAGRWRRAAALVGLLVLLVPAQALLGLLAAPTPARAQTTPVVAERYDVDLTVQTDGSLAVAQQLALDFAGGPFRHGFSLISLARVEAIRDVQVGEQGRPYTAATSPNEPY